MCKNYIYLLLCYLLLITGCTKEKSSTSDSVVGRVEVVAHASTGPSSRIGIVDGELASDGMSVKWSIQDQLAIVGEGCKMGGLMVSQNTEESKSAAFKGSFIPPVSGNNVFALYPASIMDNSNFETVPLNISRQYAALSSETKDLSRYTYMYARSEYKGVDRPMAFNFSHLMSVLKVEFTLKDIFKGEGKIILSSEQQPLYNEAKMSLSDGSLGNLKKGNIEMSVDNIKLRQYKKFDLYFAMFPQKLPSDLKFTLKLGSTILEKVVDCSAIDMKAGTKYFVQCVIDGPKPAAYVSISEIRGQILSETPDYTAIKSSRLKARVTSASKIENLAWTPSQNVYIQDATSPYSGICIDCAGIGNTLSYGDLVDIDLKNATFSYSNSVMTQIKGLKLADIKIINDESPQTIPAVKDLLVNIADTDLDTHEGRLKYESMYLLINTIPNGFTFPLATQSIQLGTTVYVVSKSTPEPSKFSGFIYSKAYRDGKGAASTFLSGGKTKVEYLKGVYWFRGWINGERMYALFPQQLDDLKW